MYLINLDCHAQFGKVDLVGVDLVAIDLVRTDLVKRSLFDYPSLTKVIMDDLC